MGGCRRPLPPLHRAPVRAAGPSPTLPPSRAALATPPPPAGGQSTPAASSTGTGRHHRGTGRPASAIDLTRVGGVAGFDDGLSVAPDGRVTGTHPHGTVDCAVPGRDGADPRHRPGAHDRPGSRHRPDRRERASGSGTTVDLGEAPGGDPLSTTARALLDDVQLPPDQRTLCR